MSQFLARARRAAAKPPQVLLARAWEELCREARRIQILRARHGRGSLAQARIVPGELAGACARTRANVSALAPWADALRAMQEDPDAVDRIQTRGRLAAAHDLELFGDTRVHVGDPPAWLVDVHSGETWPNAYYRRIDYVNAGRRSDVKVVWELSRLRHIVALAQAAALGDDAAAKIISRDLATWQLSNPMGMSVNWTCAMEVALRAVNLICADALLLAAGRELPDRPTLVSSLYQHGWFLRRNLEVSDVNGNHYLANAVGLVWLGSVFSGVGEGERWLARGLAMMRAAARDQILDSGLDQEGSLPYHMLVLEMFATARSVAPDLSDIDGRLAAMIDAALAFCDRSGRVPNIGDDDGGRVLALSDVPSRDGSRVLTLAGALCGHAEAVDMASGGERDDARWLLGPSVSAGGTQHTKHHPPTGPRHVPGGVIVLGDGAGDHIVVDVGPVGFRGRGGHGHVDALSFEAHLDGKLCVRDSGTGTYTGDPAVRNALRDAVAHNLVMIDGIPYARIGGEDRLWSITGDAPPEVRSLGGDASSQFAVIRQVLPSLGGEAVHERRLIWRPGCLDVEDFVTAPLGARIESMLHLAIGADSRDQQLVTRTHVIDVEFPRGGALRTADVACSDTYGSVKTARRATVSVRAADPTVRLAWRIRRR